MICLGCGRQGPLTLANVDCPSGSNACHADDQKDALGEVLS